MSGHGEEEGTILILRRAGTGSHQDPGRDWPGDMGFARVLKASSKGNLESDALAW